MKIAPGLKAMLTPDHAGSRPMMPPFEVDRDSRIVRWGRHAGRGTFGSGT
jgi:hypothetical protein